MKTLILIDTLGWAYHRIALALKKYGNLDLSILNIKNNVKCVKHMSKGFDQYLVMGWQCYNGVKFLPKEKTLVGIHGHHAWDNRKTAPDKDVMPPKALLKELQEFKGVNAVSKRLCKLFPFAVYTPNGVDTDIFYKKKDPFQNKRVTIGCAYSGDKHEWRKGVAKYILPAAEKAGARVKIAKRDVSFDKMCDYYNGIDIYVCASSSEGMSLSVLEAMACGRPVISTWPSELPTYNVQRNVEAISDAIINAKFKFPPFKYSWKTRAKAWEDFINGT